MAASIVVCRAWLDHQPDRAEVGAALGLKPEALPLLGTAEVGRRVDDQPGRGRREHRARQLPPAPLAHADHRDGPSRNSGYSLVAAPSPTSTPVASGRPRAQVHSAPATSTTASRSQLMRPVSTSAGDAAKAAASHGRRGSTPASSQADSSARTREAEGVDDHEAAQLPLAPGRCSTRSPAGTSQRASTSGEPVSPVRRPRGAVRGVGDADGVLHDLVAVPHLGSSE